MGPACNVECTEAGWAGRRPGGAGEHLPAESGRVESNHQGKGL